MSLKPITCKHCQKIISPSPYIFGEPENVRMMKTVQKMAKHLQSRKEQEEANSIANANGKPFKAGPHHAAVVALEMTVAGIANYQISTNFELSEDLEAARELGRHSIHEASRAVRMADEDLEYIAEANGLEGMTRSIVLNYLRDLRDCYEGLGKYAPTQPAPEPAPAVQP